jgi:hypothetical protein
MMKLGVKVLSQVACLPDEGVWGLGSPVRRLIPMT